MDVVKSLPNVAIHIETGEDAATILCDTASFSLKTLSPEEWPGFPTVHADTSLTVPFETFSHMVRRVAKVVSRDESRAILTGVMMEAADGTLKMVATDSYRLAITETEFEGPIEGFKAVISGSFLMDLASLPVEDDHIEIGLSENQIMVKYGSTSFINRRIEGNYPNYNQLLPASFETRAEYATKPLIDAVKRTSLLSNKTAPVKFDLNNGSQTTQISTASQDIGAASETIASKIEGEDVEIAFNFAYVLDGLSSVENGTVSLELQGSMKPGIFKADAQERFLYLIMPVRMA